MAYEASKMMKPAASSSKPKRVGSYCFTRSVSSRYDSLGSRSEISSNYGKENREPGGGGGGRGRDTKTRRVLSDITNVSAGSHADVSINHPVESTPLKSSPETHSHEFSAKARLIPDSSQKRRTSQPCNAGKSGNKCSGTSVTTFSKCNVGKTISKCVEPSAAESALKPKVQTQSKRSLHGKEGGGISPIPCAQSPPSKLSTLRKKILEKVSGKSIAKPKCQVQRRSISKDKELRRLSMVLRSEQELVEKSKMYEEKLHHLQEKCHSKESEIESVRNVGKMLGKLCVNQAEELKALKGMFPPTLREVVQLRELCQKQERELRDARTVVPSLQEQVKQLTTQLDLLSDDIEKVKAARLARRLNLDGASAKSGAGSNNTEQAHQRENSSRQPGKVTNLLTENLEKVMAKINLDDAQELTFLEDTCARAFQDLGFTGREPLNPF